MEDVRNNDDQELRDAVEETPCAEEEDTRVEVHVEGEEPDADTGEEAANTSDDEDGLVTLTAEEFEALNGAAERSEEYHNALLRKAADFENLRRRTAKEKTELQASHLAVTDMLPVLDNLERALEVAGEDEGARSLWEGVQMVYEQFQDVLKRKGIERIEAVGLPFDPFVHEAVATVQDPDAEPNTVHAVMQAGYRAGDRVIRPCRVVVAMAPAKTGEPAEEEENE